MEIPVATEVSASIFMGLFSQREKTHRFNDKAQIRNIKQICVHKHVHLLQITIIIHDYIDNIHAQCYVICRLNVKPKNRVNSAPLNHINSIKPVNQRSINICCFIF